MWIFSAIANAVGRNFIGSANYLYDLIFNRAKDDGGVTEAQQCTIDQISYIDKVGLISQASLLVTPTSYKEGKLYADLPTNGNGDFTVTRATTATRVNSAGLVDLVPYNLVRYSEMFADATWVKTGSSISANVTTAPDGTLTADKLVENNLNSTHRAIMTYTANLVAHTATIYAKSSGRNWIQIFLDANNGTFAYFDLLNGTLGSVGAGVTSTITSVGDGWYRCSITATPTASGAFWVLSAQANNVNTYLGDGTSGIFIWGAQIVEGTSERDYLRTETRLNIPRIDYSLGGCPNILLEPQRTNLALQSSSFDNGIWNKNASTATANTTISPSGILDADTIEGNGILSLHQIQQNITYTSGLAYSASIYAKKNTNNFIQIVFGASTFGANAFANFDLNSGVVGTIGSSATARIENVGNGWYRCIMTATATASATTTSSFGLITSATSARGESNTLSTSVFLWGAQIEAGAYATSFIPTTTASVTRNADVCSNTNASAYIGQTEGTIFLDFILLPNNANSSYLFSVSDGTTSNLIRSEILVVSPTVSQFRTGINTLGVNQGDAFTNITQLNNKMAISYKLNEIKIFLNGVLVATDTSATIPTTSQVHLGNRNNTGNFIGSYYKSFMLFPTPLTDAQMSMLTSGIYPTAAAAYASLGLVSESPSCLTSTTTF